MRELPSDALQLQGVRSPRTRRSSARGGSPRSQRGVRVHVRAGVLHGRSRSRSRATSGRRGARVGAAVGEAAHRTTPSARSSAPSSSGFVLIYAFGDRALARRCWSVVNVGIGTRRRRDPRPPAHGAVAFTAVAAGVLLVARSAFTDLGTVLGRKYFAIFRINSGGRVDTPEVVRGRSPTPRSSTTLEGVERDRQRHAR